jgi:hypothetical protein
VLGSGELLEATRTSPQRFIQNRALRRRRSFCAAIEQSWLQESRSQSAALSLETLDDGVLAPN